MTNDTRAVLSHIAANCFALADDFTFPIYEICHVEMTEACAFSPYCPCGPRLVFESPIDGSEIWRHHSVN